MLPPSWKSEVQKAIEETANASSERQKAEGEKNSAEIAAAIKRFVHAYDAQHDKPERKDKVKRLLDVTTVILLFGTAIFTGLGWLAFRSQLAEMRKVYDPIVKSANAARDAADASGRQVSVAIDAEQRQLRAYVGIVAPPDNRIAANSFIPPNIPTVILSVKNFGQTPAYKAVPLSNLGIEPYPLPTDFKFPLPVAPTPGSPITMFPGMLDIAGIYADANRALTPEEYSSIQNDGKNARLYVWGTVTYDDAFGVHHFSNYCLNFYVVSAIKIQRGFCSAHNDSD